LDTSPQGGKSWGSIRQEQPERTMYNAALTISRREYFRGRPVGRFSGGNKWAMLSHWSSLRSLGYCILASMPAV